MKNWLFVLIVATTAFFLGSLLDQRDDQRTLRLAQEFMKAQHPSFQLIDLVCYKPNCMARLEDAQGRDVYVMFMCAAGGCKELQ